MRNLSRPAEEIRLLIMLFASMAILTIAAPEPAATQTATNSQTWVGSPPSVERKGAYPVRVSPGKQAVYLAPLPPGMLDALKRPEPTQLKGKLQVGVSRQLANPITLNARAVPASEWNKTVDGWHVWSASVVSDGSLGIRLHLENLALPKSARVLVYAAAKPGAQPVVLTGMESAGRREAWTDTVFSDHVIIECQVPEGVDTQDVSFEVKELSHLYLLPTVTFTKEGTCHNDVSCYPAWASEARGVARISFVESGNTYLCSGCLLANPNPSNGEEYFLTANHCVTGSTVASTVEFFWLYQTSSCNGAAPDITQVPTTSGGAELLAASSASDFSFMKLKRSAPGGVSFLNWSLNAPGSGETLACIHHPDGSYKRISFGRFYNNDSDFWAVKWFSGVTEGGSSGSPLFNSSHQVIGQLNGGFMGPGSSCNDPSAPDQFGRFDVSYPTMQRWLGGSSGGTGTDFTAVAGSYNGLFSDGSSNPQSSGFISLLLTTKGKFSAKLQIGARKYSLTGVFDSNGSAAATVPQRGGSPITAQLQVDLSGGSQGITGQISDGNWTASLQANLNAFNRKSTVAPETGIYTMVIAGDTSSDAPDGAGYGTLTVDRTGRVKFAGALADGTKVSQSAYLSQAGDWPFYVALYAGRGMAQSWIKFGDTGASDLSGDIDWVRPGTVGRYYPNGFNIARSVSGSQFSRITGGNVIGLSDATLVLSGGDLGGSVSEPINIDGRNKVTTSGGAKLSMRFSASNGTFTGKLSDPDAGVVASFSGVVLQRANAAYGYTLGATQSAQVSVGQ